MRLMDGGLTEGQVLRKSMASKFIIILLFINFVVVVVVIVCCSVAKSCPTLCNPIDCSTPGFSFLHYLPDFAQTHVHGQRSLEGYSLWGHKELDMTEVN